VQQRYFQRKKTHVWEARHWVVLVRLLQKSLSYQCRVQGHDVPPKKEALVFTCYQTFYQFSTAPTRVRRRVFRSAYARKARGGASIRPLCKSIVTSPLCVRRRTIPKTAKNIAAHYPAQPRMRAKCSPEKIEKIIREKRIRTPLMHGFARACEGNSSFTSAIRLFRYTIAAQSPFVAVRASMGASAPF